MQQHSENEWTGRDRSIAQFFFEVGYGACFAEAMVQNDCKPPFELTDAHMDAAFPRSIEAHEDGAEMDQFLSLAKAAPDLFEALNAIDSMWSDDGEGGRVEPDQARSPKAREIWTQTRAALAKATSK